jgi:hypothetical protein
VEHDYLWRALASYGIPEEFIRIIKALYSDADTYVMVNREMSKHPLKVTRGVGQGDSLSCSLRPSDRAARGRILTTVKPKRIQDKREKRKT